MEIAISYLQELWKAGYFRTNHTFCDNVWLEKHPACSSGLVWQSVKKYLIDNKYIKVAYLPEDQIDKASVHPKDEMDLWWFEITEKGKKICS